jgi:hypothetical protein
LGLTTTENVLSAVAPAASATCTVKLEVPELLGVPEITPLALSRISPTGRPPENTTQL